MNYNDYNYITGYFNCSNVDDKYTPWGSTLNSYYSWMVDFESVKVTGEGLLAEHIDSDTDGWRVGINSSKHPYVYWSRSASTQRNTYTFGSLTVDWNTFYRIKWEITSTWGGDGAGSTIKCTVGSNGESINASGRWQNNYDRNLRVGNSGSTIRGTVTVRGYYYNSNTLQTATFNLDNLAVGATSATVNDNSFTLSSAVQKYLATYAVSYNANGGSGTVAGQTKTYGTALTLRSSGYTKDGYTLSKWTLDSTSGTEYSLGGTYTRDAAATFYAKWTQNTYTVSFNANGGSGSQSSLTKYGGTALTLPSSTTFTYTGRHITKWRLNSASGTEYNLGGSYTTNAAATFYAKWEYNTYTVVFNANGGSGTMANESMTYGTSKALTTNAYTKSGYRFLGWATSSSGSVVYTDGQSVSNLTSTNNGTVTLWAVWQSAGVRVKHNGTWKTGQVYVKHNGTWKLGRVYAKNNGQWKEGT